MVVEDRSKIVLCTGYEVPLSEPDAIQHLMTALVGEIVVGTPGDWDTRLKALTDEIWRLCETYKEMSYAALLRETMQHLEGIFEDAFPEKPVN